MPGKYEELTIQMDVDKTNSRYQLAFPFKNIELKLGTITHLSLDQHNATYTELGETELSDDEED